MDDYAATRLRMVDSQLRTNKVTDPAVLEAFEQVPRELFVPGALRGIAYVDEDVEVGPGRFVMEPMVLARLLQAARPQPGDVALDLGCGAGYASAILARLCATVVALEADPQLAARATQALGELGIDNAVVVEGPLEAGYPAQGPYDVILVSGAVSEVPEAIRGQLAEGGRLVAVVRNADRVGRAMLLQRSGGVVSGRILFDAAVPLLPGFEAKPGFVF